MYLRERAEVESIFCMVDEVGEFGMPPAGRVFLEMLAGWLLLDDLRDPKLATWWTGSAECLDMFQSWREFVGELDTRQRVGKAVELDVLNPVICIGSIYVVGADPLRGLCHELSQRFAHRRNSTIWRLYHRRLQSGRHLFYPDRPDNGLHPHEASRPAAISVEAKGVDVLSRLLTSLFEFIKGRYVHRTPMVFLFKKRSVFIYFGPS